MCQSIFLNSNKWPNESQKLDEGWMRGSFAVCGGSHGSYPFSSCTNKFVFQNCNNMECGFDAGDCGTSHFDQVYEVQPNKDHNYTLPNG